MRRYFAIGTIVGAVAMTLGACGSDSNSGGGNTGGSDSGVGGGTGGIGGGGNNCTAYCAKLTTAGCAPANCASDCAGKPTCVPAWNSLVQCAASTGTVTCTAGAPQVAGCDSQSAAYADCLSGSGGTGGGTGGGGTGGGGTVGSCQGNCDLVNMPVPGSDPECYCDSQCVDIGDCCPDKEQYCPDAPPPGTCRKLCCGASDCASGESCTAINAPNGTLGVCTTGAPADSGTGGAPSDAAVADAAPSDAAPPDSGGLPAGCVVNVPADCNPLTQVPCDTANDVACDLGQVTGDAGPVLTLTCLPGSTEAAGAPCDDGAGPWCVPGYHCDMP